MKAALRRGDVLAALALFDPSLPGTKYECADQWDALVEAHGKRGDALAAVATITDMRKSGVPVGYVAHSCVVSAFCSGGDFEGAAAYIDAEVPTHLADGPCRQLVVAATKAGRREVAAAGLAAADARGVWRSADTWVFALRLRGLQGDAEGLAADWEALQRSPLGGSPKLAAAHVSALALCGKLPEALTALEEFARSVTVAAANAQQAQHAQQGPETQRSGSAGVGREAGLQGNDGAAERSGLVEVLRRELVGGSASSEDDVQSMPFRRQDTRSARNAESYVHHASRELAAEAFRRRDLSTVHNLMWTFEELGLAVSAPVLDTLLRLSALDGADSAALENMLEDALSRGVAPGEGTFVVLLRAYAAEGDLEQASEVLDHMRAADIVPTSMSYNALLEAHAIAGDMEAMEALLDDMSMAQVRPDVCTFIALFRAVKQWHLQRRGQQREAAVEPGSKVGDTAEKHAQKQARQEAQQRLGQWVDLWRASGVRPSPELLTTLVQAHGHLNDLGPMLELLRSQWAGPAALRPTLRTCNAALGACSRHAALGVALRIKADMVRQGLAPDVRSYTALIGAAALAGDLPRAQHLFDSMAEAGVEPNIWTYNALIKAHCQAKQLATALEVVASLEAAGLAPDDATWLTLLDSARHLQRPEVVEQVLEKVPADKQHKYAAYRAWASDTTTQLYPPPLYGSDSDDDDWGWA